METNLYYCKPSFRLTVTEVETQWMKVWILTELNNQVDVSSSPLDSQTGDSPKTTRLGKDWSCDTCDADSYVSGFKGAMKLIINFASCPLWCHVWDEYQFELWAVLAFSFTVISYMVAADSHASCCEGAETPGVDWRSSWNWPVSVWSRG